MAEKALRGAEIQQSDPAGEPSGPDPASVRAALHGRLGIGVPLAEIREWVESWDTDHERPSPEAREIF